MAKKSSLFKTVTTIVTLSALTLSVAVGAILSRALRRPKFANGDVEVIDNSGNGGDYVAKSIDKIENTASYGQIDEYTIFYTDDTTSTFIVTNGVNGQDGEPGIQGFPGVDGHTPEIKIGTNGNWFIDGLDTGEFAQGPQGEPGITPHIGSNGNWWIGEVDTEVQAIGRNGKTPLIGANGHWWIGGTDTGVSAYGQPGPEGPEGPAGRGIQSIEKTDSQGLIDTYTITYTDGTTSEFLVTNGANGETAAQGLPGQDGRTPVITIGSNGNWFVDGVDTEVAAQGPQGPQGEQGQAGNDGLSLIPGEGEPTATLGKNGDSYVDTQSWNYYVKENDAWVLKGNIKGESNAGNNGLNGKSAYEIAVDNGYTGTEAEWLASLIGEAGANGDIGNNGKSAYELAVENGFTGTEEQWLATLIGPEGAAGAAGQDGKSVYELAVENGFTGSLDEWLTSLVGEQGQQGQQGQEGKSAYELAVENGYTGTLEQWLTSLAGEDGVDGVDGVNGKSAYDLAVEHGFSGTEEEWLASLIGQDGAAGAAGQDGKSAYELAVENGFSGTITEWMDSLVGQDGADGSALRTGNGEPENDLGLDGDSFVDLESYNFYVKEAGEWVLKGNIKGANGLNGISIVSVEKTNTEGLVDTYTITYSDGNTTTFTVTNGVQGQDGNTLLVGTGAPTSETTANVGDSYIDVETWKLYVKGEDNWTDKGSFKGDKGDQGEQGEQGVSITDISYDSSSGLVDTYLISYSDGTNDTFAVTNGQDGTSLKTGYGNPNIASVDDPATTEDETRDDPVTGIEGDSFLDLHSWDYYVLEDVSGDLEWVFKGNIHNIPDTFEVSFNTNGGSAAPANQTVQAGYGLEKPEDPTKDDYFFQGWYTQGGKRWDFDKDVPTGDIELTAVWAQFRVENGILVETTATGDVIIPGFFDEQLVVGIGENVFKDKDDVTTVYIPSSVTSIAASAFENCTALNSAVIPASVTSIEENAFKGCTALAYIYFSEGLRYIGASAFEDCSRLKAIALPTSVESIGLGAFQGCASLKSMSLPYVANIPKASDYYTYGVGAPDATVHSKYYFDISNSDTYYYDGADWTVMMNFEEMAGGPEHFAYGAGAPSNSLAIEAYLDYETFDVYMYNGAAYQLMANYLQYLDMMSGSSSGGTAAVTYHFGLYFGAVSYDNQNDYVPESLKTVNIIRGADENADMIPSFAFYGLKNIKSITIPNNIATIGQMAFAYCDGLETFVVPDSVIAIGLGAFTASKGWTKFDNLLLSYGLKIEFGTSWANSAYFHYDDITMYHEGDTFVFTRSGFGDTGINVYEEKTHSFDNKTNVWGGSLQYYQDLLSERDTVAPTPKVGELYNAADTNQIFIYTSTGWVEYKMYVSGYGYYEDMPAQGNYHGEMYLCTEHSEPNFVDPHSNEIYRWDAVKGEWIYIDTILYDRSDIVPTYSTVDPNASDAEDKYLNALHFNLESGDMFVNCASNLKSLTIPFVGTEQKRSVTYNNTIILLKIFTDSSGYVDDGYKWVPFSLKNVYVTQGNINDYNEFFIGECAFENCCFIENVFLPDHLIQIGAEAFRGCRNLRSIALPSGLKKIGVLAFSDTGLDTVVIPESVTYLGDMAFFQCQKMTGFYMNSGTCDVGYGLAERCPRLKYFVLNCNLESDPGTVYWVENDKALEYISLGFGIEVISNSTFANSYYHNSATDSLIAVNLPASVKVIGDYSFSEATNLKAINIPESLIEIGDCAFLNCTSLTSINLPKGLTTICSAAFQGCTGLTSMVVPDTVEVMGAGVFNGCNNLESLMLPFIGGYADTYSIENVRIYNDEYPGVKIYDYHIERFVDENAKDGDIFIESGDTEGLIWRRINGQWHRQFYIADTPNGFGYRWSVGDGAPSSISGNHAYLDRTTGTVYLRIGGSIRPVGNFMDFFSRFDFIFAPFDNDHHYGYSGFNNYADFVPASLKNVTITNGVYDNAQDEYFVKNDAFRKNASIETITIGDTVNRIDDRAFMDCSSLRYVIFGEDSLLTTIGERAFEDCSSLRYFVTPEGVNSIGSMAFLRCSSLASISLPFAGDGGSNTNFGYIFGTLASNEDNTSEPGGANIPTALKTVNITVATSVANSTFINCNNIKNINYTNEVTSIGDSAFKNCSSLISADLMSNATAIGQSAFSGCSNLKEAILGEGLEEIEDYVFENCARLRYVDLPTTLEHIGECSFKGCKSLQSLMIPDAVEDLGAEAFINCTLLNSIILPENSSFTVIPNNCFKNCQSLVSIVLPETVATIGVSAFENCKSLNGTVDLRHVATIRESAFEGCHNISTLIIDVSVLTTLEDNAFKDCYGIASVMVFSPGQSTVNEKRTYYRDTWLAGSAPGTSISLTGNEIIGYIPGQNSTYCNLIFR